MTAANRNRDAPLRRKKRKDQKEIANYSLKLNKIEQNLTV
jgi:hypothetical protein